MKTETDIRAVYASARELRDSGTFVALFSQAWLTVVIEVCGWILEESPLRDELMREHLTAMAQRAREMEAVNERRTGAHSRAVN